MRKQEFRAFDTRINTMYDYVVIGWNGEIEARTIPNDHESIEDIRLNSRWKTFEDYDGEIIISEKLFIEDKNGKVAYNGDIVKEYGGGKIGKIQWNENKLHYEIFFGYGDIWTIDKRWFKTCEILGDIWQNKDMLTT